MRFVFLSYKCLFIFYMPVLYQICILQFFFPCSWLVFSFSNSIFSKNIRLIFIRSNLWILSFMIHTFCVFLKKYLPIPKLQRFSLVFFQKFYDFRFHIEVYNSLSVHFCLWCKEWVKVVFIFLAFGCPVVLAAFVRIGYLLSVELT